MQRNRSRNVAYGRQRKREMVLPGPRYIEGRDSGRRSRSLTNLDRRLPSHDHDRDMINDCSIDEIYNFSEQSDSPSSGHSQYQERYTGRPPSEKYRREEISYSYTSNMYYEVPASSFGAQQSVEISPRHQAVRPQLTAPKHGEEELRREEEVTRVKAKQIEEYKKKAALLKEEIETLKEQRIELRGDRERSPSPDTKQFLKENTKLQMEIQNKLKKINNLLDMLNKGMGEHSAENQEPPESPERKTKKWSQKFNYIFYDPELHWCRVCNEFPQTAKHYLNHLHSPEHQTNAAEHVEAPWHNLPGTNEGYPTLPNAPTKRTPIRGLQFFVPATAWFCKLCDQFVGDLHCASAHIKSILHSNNYNKFVQQNPHWETDWVSDRQRAFERTRPATGAPDVATGARESAPERSESCQLQYVTQTLTISKDVRTKHPPKSLLAECEEARNNKLKQKSKSDRSTPSTLGNTSDFEIIDEGRPTNKRIKCTSEIIELDSADSPATSDSRLSEDERRPTGALGTRMKKRDESQKSSSRDRERIKEMQQRINESERRARSNENRDRERRLEFRDVRAPTRDLAVDIADLKHLIQSRSTRGRTPDCRGDSQDTLEGSRDGMGGSRDGIGRGQDIRESSHDRLGRSRDRADRREDSQDKIGGSRERRAGSRDGIGGGRDVIDRVQDIRESSPDKLGRSRYIADRGETSQNRRGGSRDGIGGGRDVIDRGQDRREGSQDRRGGSRERKGGSRDGIGRGRDIGESSRNRQGRSRERMAGSRERIGRSRERMARSRERPGRSRERMGRSRERPGRSRERIGRSRERMGRSRERMGRSRDRVDRSRDRVDRRRDSRDRRDGSRNRQTDSQRGKSKEPMPPGEAAPPLSTLLPQPLPMGLPPPSKAMPRPTAAELSRLPPPGTMPPATILPPAATLPAAALLPPPVLLPAPPPLLPHSSMPDVSKEFTEALEMLYPTNPAKCAEMLNAMQQQQPPSLLGPAPGLPLAYMGMLPGMFPFDYTVAARAAASVLSGAPMLPRIPAQNARQKRNQPKRKHNTVQSQPVQENRTSKESEGANSVDDDLMMLGIDASDVGAGIQYS